MIAADRTGPADDAFTAAATRQAEAWRRLWHVVVGMLLGAIVALMLLALAGSMTGKTHPSFVTLAAILAGGALGTWNGLATNPWRRRLSAMLALALVGGLFGWEMEREPGAVTGALAGLQAGWLVAWLLAAVLARVPARWLCVGFWGLLAALLTSGALAIAIKLALGRLDDDDIAFHVAAIVAVWYWVGATGWLAEPRADFGTVLGQLGRVARGFVRSPLLPFACALVVAGAIGGPAYSHFLIDETATTLGIRRATGYLIWPAALTVAAVWLAWRQRRTAWRRTALVALAVIATGCAVNAWRTVSYHIEADAEKLVVHGRTFARADVQRIDYLRRTGRRYVLHQPVLVLRNDRRVELALDSGAAAAANFVARTWNVPAAKP